MNDKLTEHRSLKIRESILQLKLVSYTSSCRNFMLMMLFAHSLYLLPVLFFEKFCKYSHVISMFSERWYVGFGYVIWILFMALTAFYSHKYKSVLSKNLYENTRNYEEILYNVKRLTISLIIMECWNWAGLLVPIWSISYFLVFTRPNESYFYEFLITPETIHRVQPIFDTAIRLIMQLQNLDTRVQVSNENEKNWKM